MTKCGITKQRFTKSKQSKRFMHIWQKLLSGLPAAYYKLLIRQPNKKTIELNKYIDKSRSCIVPATTDVLTCNLCHCNVSQLVAASSVTSMPWNEKQQLFFSLFLRGGVPSPNFLKLFTILWKFYTTDNFYNFKVLYMTHL